VQYNASALCALCSRYDCCSLLCLLCLFCFSWLQGCEQSAVCSRYDCGSLLCLLCLLCILVAQGCEGRARSVSEAGDLVRFPKWLFAELENMRGLWAALQVPGLRG